MAGRGRFQSKKRHHRLIVITIPRRAPHRSDHANAIQSREPQILQERPVWSALLATIVCALSAAMMVARSARWLDGAYV